jgi:hypothetical protein
VVAQNPAATAESDIDVRIPFLQDRLQIDMICRFKALETWDISDIQSSVLHEVLFSYRHTGFKIDDS